MDYIWENDWRPELWSICRAQNDSEIGRLGPIFSIPLNVAQVDMYTTTDVKSVENLWEKD